ncbi:MAG: hypothetical protein GX050_09620 [Firmicutes bacterium]|nr:hypothetical protein [Bacillota bacterium]
MRNIIHALGLILLLLACLIFFRKTVSPSATSTPRLVWTSRAALILFLIVMAFLIMMWRSGAAHSPVGRNEVLYKKDTLYHQLVVTQSGPPQYYIFPVYGWFGVEDIAEQNIILIATLDPHYRPKAVWQKRAEELYAAKLIAEDVPSFTPVMVDDPLFFQEEWLTGGPLLTDDYAPVDTLKHPLL